MRRQEQRKKLIARGISCRAAEAVADATAAAVAAQGLGSSWAEELAAAYPRLGPSSALVASALAGAPLELHMHLKTLFCATLKAALLSDIAVLELEHAAHPERKQSTAEADMRWLLSKTESVFKEIFYDPAFLAMASACDFEKPARELLRALQQLRAARNCTSSGATESLLPLLLTEKGRCALERFIAAVDEDILSSLCSSWEGSGVLQLHASQEQGKEDTSAPRTRQLSARHTGKDAGTSMALASYADERCKTDAPRETHRGAPLFLRASDVKAAKEAIERQGFVVLKGALTPKQLQDAQKATFSASGAAAEGALKMKEVDPNIYCTRPTYDALALPQSWHRDNSYRGLTVVIPLVPIHLSNGPTELLPGSHILSGEVN
ncbi:hypothetical protein, conserved [Eimeria necatrix]|uniref:Uncharacterized protein n=1 Tax=Eimeria necatrix TaxID=51315 RepID=U6MNF8_9EIME|nr:hypothetical protein, conserved [Eimeria necatrix]CDJ65767.1 hypothetical protein, conserved [Eimeria necatrix]